MRPLNRKAWWGHLTALIVMGLFYRGFASAGNLQSGTMKIIKGSIWYRERMLPPPDTQISVILEDVSRIDVASDVIATTRFAPKGGPPWEFGLPYDPAKIHPKRRYTLRGRIEANDRLLFINTEHIPIFENSS